MNKHLTLPIKVEMIDRVNNCIVRGNVKLTMGIVEPDGGLIIPETGKIITTNK